MTKLEARSFGTHVKQLLDHKPSVILIARLSSFLVMYTGIPVTESQSVWPDENGYRYTEWALSLYLHREGAKSHSRIITVTRHTVQCTQNLFY